MSRHISPLLHIIKVTFNEFLVTRLHSIFWQIIMSVLVRELIVRDDIHKSGMDAKNTKYRKLWNIDKLIYSNQIWTVANPETTFALLEFRILDNGQILYFVILMPIAGITANNNSVYSFWTTKWSSCVQFFKMYRFLTPVMSVKTRLYIIYFFYSRIALSKSWNVGKCVKLWNIIYWIIVMQQPCDLYNVTDASVSTHITCSSSRKKNFAWRMKTD